MIWAKQKHQMTDSMRASERTIIQTQEDVDSAATISNLASAIIIVRNG
jgi:hypothetical protein